MNLDSKTIALMAERTDMKVRGLIEDAALDGDSSCGFDIFVTVGDDEIAVSGTALFGCTMTDAEPETGMPRMAYIGHVGYLIDSIDLCPDEEMPEGVLEAVRVRLETEINNLYNNTKAA